MSTPSVFPLNHNYVHFPIASPPILHLPEELRLEIFAALVKDTGSSASLLASATTCREFRRLLVGEPKLWTRLRIDASFVLHETSIPGRADWPRLNRILHLSAEEKLTLTLAFEGASNEDNAMLQKMLREKRLDKLMALLREEALTRCTEITVRCSLWDMISSIAQHMDDEEYPLPYLTSLSLRYLPLDPTYQFRHPAGDEVPFSPIQAPEDCAGCPPNLEQYGIAMLPFLTKVILDGFPIDYQCFCPNFLTSLTLVNVPQDTHPLSWEDLEFVLHMNQETLTWLNLGMGALPKQKNDYDIPSIRLPRLIGLGIEYTDPIEMLCLAGSLDVPNLRELSVGNGTHCNPKFNTTAESPIFNEMVQNVLAAHMAILTHWPLQQVTQLRMYYPEFHDVARNPISKLEASYSLPEAWEGGIPIVSQFFYRFEALQLLELYGPHDSTMKILEFPPAIWNESGQPMIQKYFPNIRWCRCGHELFEILSMDDFFSRFHSAV